VSLFLGASILQSGLRVKSNIILSWL